MTYTEEELDDSIRFSMKINDIDKEINPTNRWLVIQEILAIELRDMILIGSVDVDRDTFLLATAYGDLLTKGHFLFKVDNERD